MFMSAVSAMSGSFLASASRVAPAAARSNGDVLSSAARAARIAFASEKATTPVSRPVARSMVR